VLLDGGHCGLQIGREEPGERNCTVRVLLGAVVPCFIREVVEHQVFTVSVLYDCGTVVLSDYKTVTEDETVSDSCTKIFVVQFSLCRIDVLHRYISPTRTPR
jgi:hypothetical protein